MKHTKCVANYCMDNPNHRMFIVTDGARCVDCEGMVGIKEVTESEYRRLPTYNALRKNKLNATNSKGCNDLSARQIELLKYMIELNKQIGLSICSCDVKRVLEMRNGVTNDEGIL